MYSQGWEREQGYTHQELEQLEQLKIQSLSCVLSFGSLTQDELNEDTGELTNKAAFAFIIPRTKQWWVKKEKVSVWKENTEMHKHR